MTYEMPKVLREYFPVKDTTLRSKITKKCKEMDAEGYLATTTEPADQGFRYIFTRVQGENLIPQWFTDMVKLAMEEKEGKVTCKNCGYREDCILRLAYTRDKKEGTLTKEVKDNLNEMCKAVRGTLSQIGYDMRRKGIMK